jgi:hypothetical protein
MTRACMILGTLVASCAAVLLAAGPTTTPAGGAAKVEVVGLAVTKADPNSKFGESAVPGQMAGTHVHVRIAAPGKYLVGLDEEACALESFTDDKGTVLAKPGKGRQFGESWLWGFPRFSDDRQSCVVSIQSKACPAAGATAVKIKAGVAMLCGSQEKTAEQKDVALKAGTKVTAGPIPMEIASVEARSGGEPATEVRFKGEAPEADLAKLKGVTFLGADGKEIPSQSTGRMNMGGDKKVSFEYGYELKGSPKQVTIKITWFDKVETLTVPVNATVGAGL